MADNDVLTLEKLQGVVDTVAEARLKSETEMVEAFMALGFTVQVNSYMPKNTGFVVLPETMRKAYEAALAKITGQGGRLEVPINGVTKIINIGDVA